MNAQAAHVIPHQTYRHCLPRFNIARKVILDIGCNDGRDLAYPEFETCAARHGIDPDRLAIGRGSKHHPELRLQWGSAENLPYGDASVDIVMSRVALPYTDIPRALSEIRRVLKPDGMVFFTLHDWRMQWRWFWQALKGRKIKRIFDHAYIVPASVGYVLTGRVMARPWNGTRETFQTQRRFRRSMKQAGFDEILMGRTDKHLICQAMRAQE